MRTYPERLEAMNAQLAPYATPHESRGRIHPEDEDGIRAPFQRDHARIVHSHAFRRLAGKTQVFVAGQDPYFRTRHTHTIEVAQITRNLARALGLNEDLAECVALAHDLGHAPFGHAGQDALDEWMKGHGMRFEHNLQSHRIVTLLELRRTHNGLNLTRDVVEGLLKHGGTDERGRPVTLSPEAKLANVCDEIAYVAHDTDDGLYAGLFTYDELQRAVPLARRAGEKADAQGTFIRGTLIDIMVRDLLAHAETTVRASGTPEIGLSPALRAELQPLRAFLWNHMYRHPQVLDQVRKGQASLRALCSEFLANPPDAVRALQERTRSCVAQAVTDHVASMTDAVAAKEAAALPA